MKGVIMQLHTIVGDSLRKKYGKKFQKIQQKNRGFTLNFFGHFCAAENLRSLNGYNEKYFNGGVPYNQNL